MVLVQKWPFFQLSFLGNIGKTKKLAFFAIKKRSSESPKIEIFPKELVHGFGPKMTIFPTCSFSINKCQDNVFYHILERKSTCLG